MPYEPDHYHQTDPPCELKRNVMGRQGSKKAKPSGATTSFKPNKLWIERGEVCCGTAEVSAYLWAWQEHHGIEDGTQVRVMTEKTYQELISRANMAGIA